MWPQSEQPASLLGGPTPRAGHTSTCIFYQGSEAILVLGGFDGDAVLNDAFVFTPPQQRWERLQTSGQGIPPAPRAMHAAAMLGRTLIVHGGWGGVDLLRADTCCLHLSTAVPQWEAPSQRLSLDPGPAGRQGHTLVAAPRTPLGAAAGATPQPELFLFGGDTGTGVSNELWSLTVTADGQQLVWKPVAPSGTPPPARSGHAACILPADGSGKGDGERHMLIFGGRTATGETLGDLHVFCIDGRRWSQPRVNGDVPRPRWACACCVLPAGGPRGPRLVVHGGRDSEGWVVGRGGFECGSFPT